MNFSSLCEFYEEMRQLRTQQEKIATARQFFMRIRQSLFDCFLVMRLVVPKLDRDRQAYRIKESKISRIIVRMLALPPGPDQNFLSKAALAGGDFGSAIYSIIKKYIVNRKTQLTIQEIDEHLEKIANRPNDSGLDDLLLEIIRKLSCIDIKWFIQIILKSLHLGIGDNALLNCYHQDGAAYYAMNNNLKKVCETLLDPSSKLHELEINIFEPFRPMLSKRCDSSNFKKCFPAQKSFTIENKFDGERFQLHMQNGQFKYFSRNGFDFTSSFGANFNDGLYTPNLKTVFHPEVNRLILDGEMMLWNNVTKDFGSKGMNLDVKNLGKGKYQPCFCAFDILMYNDKVLTNQPLKKRMNYLKHAIRNPLKGVIAISDVMDARTQQDIVDALNFSIEKNEEGIVVKDPQSVYRYAERNCGWFKLKMDYFDDIVHDLDVLVMGGFYGPNNRINSFMVGMSSGSKFLSLGRIATGLTYEQIDILDNKLKKEGLQFKDFVAKSKGKLIFGRETPDLYVEPEKSYVLQVRASELIRTHNDSVKSPYTLRFPRVLKIRDDKLPSECLSMNELLELTGQNKDVIKINKRRIELDEITPKVKPSKIQKLDKIIKHEHSKNIGNFLADYKFFVFSGTENWEKYNISNSIKKAGGKLAYKFEKGIDIIIANYFNEKILKCIDINQNFDVVSCDWIRRVLDAKQLLPYKPIEIIHIGSNFKCDLGNGIDMFGDSFTEEATVESLQRVFDLMNKKGQNIAVNDAVVVPDNCRTDFFKLLDTFLDSKLVNTSNQKKNYHSTLN